MPEVALAPQEPRAPVAFGATPQTLEQAWRFAQMLAASDLVPKDYRGKPENCIVAMQYGAEVGLAPMAALQSIAVINGKPGLYGDGFLAVITDKPTYVNHVEYYLVRGERRDRLTAEDLKLDDTCAVTEFYRAGRAEPFVGSFSIGEARKAGLLGKEGPWTNYPARMLRWRARAWAGRDGFARELRGMGSAEELRDRAAVETIADAPIVAPQRRSHAAPPIEVEPAPEIESAPEVEAPAAAPEIDTPPPTGEVEASAPPRPPTRGAPSVQTTKDLVIEETLMIPPKKGTTGKTAYEIRGIAQSKPPIGYTFITEDEDLYKQALSCEGTGVVLTATWQMGKRGDAVAKLLTALAGD